MGCSQDRVFPFRNRHLVISLLIFFASIFTQDPIFAQGRAISNPIQGLKEEREVVERELIGSRPPRCEGRCNNCGHCEAIQVPIVPQQKGTHFLVNSRGDNLLNYKPISWKCKCGNTIFNP